MDTVHSESELSKSTTGKTGATEVGSIEKVYCDGDIYCSDEEESKKQEVIEQEELHKDFFIKKQYFISHQTDDIYKYFDFDPEPLGEGSYGVVYKATEKSTKEIRAIKQINLRDIKGGRQEPLAALNESEIAEESKGLYNNFLNELASLKLLDHPNIIKLYEVYE